MSTENYLAADGVENIMRVLEDLEDEKIRRHRLCGAAGLRRRVRGGAFCRWRTPTSPRPRSSACAAWPPYAQNRLEGVPTEMLWDTDLTYAPVLELGATRSERFERYNQMQKILKGLPGLDCGSCGAPTCEAMAEDVVRGKAQVTDCTVLMRHRLEAMLRAKEGAGRPCGQRAAGRRRW